MLRGFLTLLLALSLAACTKKNEKTVWIYTSIYKDVSAPMEPNLTKQLPGVEFQWFQSGSENAAARLHAELSAGRTMADLVMTSDPAWYLELKQAGKLLPYTSPKANLPASFKDEAFSIVRMPVAVIAYNANILKNEPSPMSWDDLKDPRWKSKISMASPLESGTSVTLVAQLAKKKSWEYFAALRKNEILSAGGNSSVIQRMETGERPVGIVLLENVLEAQKRGSPIVPVYPKDGSVLVPSPIAILAETKQPELVKQIYDYFYSETMQDAVVAGRMYSPAFPKKAPRGAIPFEEIQKNALPWNSAILNDLFKERESLKKKFTEVVLN